MKGFTEGMDFPTDSQALSVAFHCDDRFHDSWTAPFEQSHIPLASVIVSNLHMSGIMLACMLFSLFVQIFIARCIIQPHVGQVDMMSKMMLLWACYQGTYRRHAFSYR